MSGVGQGSVHEMCCEPPAALPPIFPSVWLRLGHPRVGHTRAAVMDTAIARLRASASKYAAENAELRAELVAVRAQLARSQRQPEPESEPEPEPEPESPPQTRQRLAADAAGPAPPDAAALRRMPARRSPISVVLDPGPPPSVAAVVLQPWALGLIVAVPVSACFVLGVRYCQR